MTEPLNPADYGIATGEWDVAVVDGRPEIVVGLPVLARLIHASPFGVKAATEIVRTKLPADIFVQLEAELAKIANPFRKEQS